MKCEVFIEKLEEMYGKKLKWHVVEKEIHATIRMALETVSL